MFCGFLTIEAIKHIKTFNKIERDCVSIIEYKWITSLTDEHKTTIKLRKPESVRVKNSVMKLAGGLHLEDMTNYVAQIKLR